MRVLNFCQLGIKTAFALGLIFNVMGCASIGTYNPATDRKEIILISTEQEVSMGMNVHKGIEKEFKLSGDIEQKIRLFRVGQRIANVSDRQDYTYQFHLIEKDEFNAFTTPGGHVYVFTGLIKSLRSDDEIAAVLAHEIGHCAAKHVVKKYQASLSYSIIGSIIGSQIDGGSTAAAAATRGVNTAMGLIFTAYSRTDEYEADMLGIKYMRLAGYDLNGMVKTLELLESKSKGNYVPAMLKTHPHLKDRIKKVKEEIARY